MKVALLAVAKNEEHYINEWIEHYVNIGIDHIYIADNNDVEDRLISHIDSKYDSSIITIENWTGVVDIQHKFYTQKCLELKNEYNWFCVFDIDEFLDVENIKEYIETHADADVINIKWKMMYNNDIEEHLKVPDYSKSLKERFPDLCIMRNATKAIFKNSDNISRVSLHFPVYKETPVEITVYDTVLLHYMIKSFAEYIDKILRGRASCRIKKYYYINESPNRIIASFFRYWPDRFTDEIKKCAREQFDNAAKKKFAIYRNEQIRDFEYRNVQLKDNEFFNIVFYNSNVWDKFEETLRIFVHSNQIIIRTKYNEDIILKDTSLIDIIYSNKVLYINDEKIDLSNYDSGICNYDYMYIINNRQLRKPITTAIIVCAKMEELYIKEWLDWHLNEVGFDHIFICDNNDSDYEFPLIDVIKDYIDAGKVTLYNYNNIHPIQSHCYDDVYKKYKDDYDWFAIIDVDEFIHVPKYNNNLKMLLDDMPDRVETVFLNWRMYGDNELIEYDGRPVQERFPEPFYKSFKNGMHDINKPIIQGHKNYTVHHLHCGFDEKCRQRYDVLGNRIAINTRNNFFVRKAEKNELDKYVNDIVDTCYLKHFATKTIDEWVKYKMLRGYALKLKDDAPYPYRMSMFWKCNNRSQAKCDFIKNKYNIDDMS